MRKRKEGDTWEAWSLEGEQIKMIHLEIGCEVTEKIYMA
jgi:hypothetical protein